MRTNEAELKLVHDTFQHVIAGGGRIYPEYTATVHISGISDPQRKLDETLDAHRILVDRGDRCGTLEDDIRRSFEFIEASFAST